MNFINGFNDDTIQLAIVLVVVMFSMVFLTLALTKQGEVIVEILRIPGDTCSKIIKEAGRMVVKILWCVVGVVGTLVLMFCALVRIHQELPTTTHL